MEGSTLECVFWRSEEGFFDGWEDYLLEFGFRQRLNEPVERCLLSG